VSDKMIPALVAAALFASTGVAFAQPPSAEGAGQGPYTRAPSTESLAPSPYQGLNGYYNWVPTNRAGQGSAYRRGTLHNTGPENGAEW
jgi:hypothetical protein